jgi:Zn-finger nucleic acid-binding protein
MMPMPAETLSCPMCGAPASSDATQCEHCGARLATVACPSCFGMIFQGAKFCSHCGARVDRTEVAGAAAHLCPRCQSSMQPITLGKTNLDECPHCEGLWADAASLQQICTDREQQAAVLGMAAPVQNEPLPLETHIRYLPCPVCRKLMNRVNFANCSHVVVDVCKAHGTWFDKDELRRIVEFIRGGGLEQARALQIEELEEQRRRLEFAQRENSIGTPDPWGGSIYGDRHLGVSAAAAMLRSFLD